MAFDLGQEHKRQNEKSNKAQIVEGLLFRYYTGKIEATSVGWKICCPFHNDHTPSCNVYFSGVFYCWSGCAQKSPIEGFLKLGVPRDIVNDHFGNPNKMAHVYLPTLDDLEEVEEEEPTVHVLKEEPWPIGWSFRGLLPETLMDSPIANEFDSKLAYIAIKTRNGEKKESFPRLSIGFPGSKDLRIFLRLSSEQNLKVVNGDGIGEKDGIFGLNGWKLPDSCKYLVMVEGPFDLLRLKEHAWRLGKFDEIQFGAILGTHRWRIFLEKFRTSICHQMSNRSIVLAFDNDEAGEAVTAQALSDLCTGLLMPPSSVKVLNYYPTKDPGELKYEDFVNAWSKI